MTSSYGLTSVAFALLSSAWQHVNTLIKASQLHSCFYFSSSAILSCWPTVWNLVYYIAHTQNVESKIPNQWQLQISFMMVCRVKKSWAHSKTSC